MALNLLLELGVVFALAFLGATVWQRVSGRSWGSAMHRGFVFAVIVMLVYFVSLVVIDMADLRSEPPR